MNKPNLAQLVRSAKSTVSKHSPEILVGIGVGGMYTAGVLAVRETPKAIRLMEERRKQLGVEKLPPKDIVKATWRCYLAAAITALTSTACIIGGTRESLRRNAALATAYKISETALMEYREQIIEKVGEKKEQVIREAVNQKQIDKQPITQSTVYYTGDGDTLFLDPLSRRYFKSTRERIERAENVLNKQMIHDIFGTATLNDFYDEIGLDRTDLGYNMGWSTERLIDLDITPGMTDDGKPCLVIGHHNAPTYIQ